MEKKTKLNVRAEEGKVVVMQEITRIMTQEESLKEMQGLQAEIKKAENDKIQITQLIEQKKFEKDLEKIEESLGELKPFLQEWEEVNKPLYEDLKKHLERDVRKEKLKHGYDRVKDTNQKIVLQNQILGPLLEEKGLSMQHPIAHEIKKTFDQI